MFINIRTIGLILCFGGALCLIPNLVWSQPKAQKSTKQVKSNIKQKSVQKAKAIQQSSSEEKEEDLSQTAAGKVIEFSQFTIEGTIPRPSAAYLLQRRKLKFRGLTPKKSFLPALFKSVERPPF